MTHADAHELLETYALQALSDDERRRVEQHLAECAACREDAAAWQRVVDAIPEAVGERAPSSGLRTRLLSSARADLRPADRRFAVPRLRPTWVVVAALVLVSAASLALAAGMDRQLAATRAELQEYERIALKVSQGGRWWYMQGTEAFRDSGGTLIDPRKDAQAFVLFHDLGQLAADQRYAVWMIRGNGAWVRAANFRPTGERLQRVDVPVDLTDFVQCSVTVEAADAGPRRGPVAMQSRVFGQ